MKERGKPLGAAYWRLWTASTISALGDGASFTALPLLAASLTRDPRLIGGLATAASVPWLVFSLHAGAIVDRHNKRTIAAAMDVTRGVVTVFIVVSIWADWVRIPLLYTTALLIGFAEVLFGNAAQAILPSVIADPDSLERANGWQYSADVIGRQFVGPPVGSFLFAAAASVPFIIDGISFFASAALILTFKISTAPGNTVAIPGVATTNGQLRPKMRAEIAEGLQWLFQHRLLRTLAVCLGIMNLCGTGAGALLVLVAQDRLHLSNKGFGVMLAAAAVGAVFGGLVGDKVSKAVGQGRTLMLAAVAEGGQFIVIGLTHSPVVAVVAMAVAGFTATSWNVVTVSLRQQIIPERLFGRVNATYRLFGLGMMPIGGVVGGLIAHRYGLRMPFLILGGVIVAETIPISLIATDKAIAEARNGRPVEPVKTDELVTD